MKLNRIKFNSRIYLILLIKYERLGSFNLGILYDFQSIKNLVATCFAQKHHQEE